MDLLTYYSDLAVAYPEYITQKQFCEVCGICHKTAYNLTRRGEISYEIVDTPTGRIHHIKLTDALAYLYKKDTLYGNDENVNRQIYEVLQTHFSYLPDLLRTQQIRELTGFSMTAIQLGTRKAYYCHTRKKRVEYYKGFACNLSFVVLLPTRK